MADSAKRSLADKIAERMQGATFNEAEAARIINMVRCRTRVERPDAYLLAAARELMPDVVYIEWARAHLAILDARDA